ncbi:MAG: hypothetical protein IT258_24060 [Saprospiraceae bacterium]|nr:hypothetical protein [Saprospiraceae bacterium]
MTTSNLSIENLKLALLELAQADRAFFVAFLKDLTNENTSKISKQPVVKQKPLKRNGKPPLQKINPPYRQNPEAMRAKYAMDKSVLHQLQDLFKDAPTAEAFMQAASAQ